MSNTKEISDSNLPSKDDKIVRLEGWKNSIPDHMLKDAFAALSLSLLGEFFVSGDTKQMIFYGMMGNLEKMGYSEEDLNAFKKGMNEAYQKFHKPNGFMG